MSVTDLTPLILLADQGQASFAQQYGGMMNPLLSYHYEGHVYHARLVLRHLLIALGAAERQIALGDSVMGWHDDVQYQRRDDQGRPLPLVVTVGEGLHVATRNRQRGMWKPWESAFRQGDTINLPDHQFGNERISYERYCQAARSLEDQHGILFTTQERRALPSYFAATLPFFRFSDFPAGTSDPYDIKRGLEIFGPYFDYCLEGEVRDPVLLLIPVADLIAMSGDENPAKPVKAAWDEYQETRSIQFSAPEPASTNTLNALVLNDSAEGCRLRQLLYVDAQQWINNQAGVVMWQRLRAQAVRNTVRRSFGDMAWRSFNDALPDEYFERNVSCFVGLAQDFKARFDRLLTCDDIGLAAQMALMIGYANHSASQ